MRDACLTGLLGEFIGPPLDLLRANMRLEARYQKDDDAWATKPG